MLLIWILLPVVFSLRQNYERYKTQGCIAPYTTVNGKFALESCAEECENAGSGCTLFAFEHSSGKCFLTGQGGRVNSGCADETVYKLVPRTDAGYDDDRTCSCPSGWKEYEPACSDCRVNLFCRMMDPKMPWKPKRYCNLGRGVPAGWNTNEMQDKGVLTNCCDLQACEPYTEETCKKVAERLGLTLGGGGYSFAQSNFGAKGCYTYDSGYYKGHVFYGRGGSTAQQRTTSLWGGRVRPAGWDCGSTSEEQMTMTKNAAPGTPNVVLAFALVGFLATIYGAGCHFFEK